MPQGVKEEDKEIKWEKLKHAGVLFPPEYTRLPASVRMLYDGQPVDLTEDQEEVAQMFAIMKETDYMKKQLFLDNFWNDFKKVRPLMVCKTISSYQASNITACAFDLLSLVPHSLIVCHLAYSLCAAHQNV